MNSKITKYTAMKNRPFKELTNRYVEKAKNVKEEYFYSPKKPEEFSNSLNSALRNLHRHLLQNSKNIETVINPRAHNTKIQWEKDFNSLEANYKNLHKLFFKLADEEKAILRIERKAHVTALFFRFLTTVGIGFGIMFVYYVAQELEIAMPLLRIVP